MARNLRRLPQFTPNLTRWLLQAAPAPVFVADADTGKIVEANQAAETLRGEPREEIVGRHQSELHPASEADAYRQLFEEHVETGGTRRRLPSGTPIRVTADGGEHIPVEISVEKIKIGEKSLIYGVFRDISDQLAYERTLTGLNEATRDLFNAETPADISQFMVETVTEILDLSAASFYRFDEREGVLRPETHAHISEVEALIGDYPTFGPGDGIAWRVFTERETAAFDDVRTDEDVFNPETSIRSEIIVPVGDWGVLIVGDPSRGVFDERDVHLVEIIGATATAALERVEHEQELRRREQELKQQTRQLSDVEALNTRIRNVARAIVQSDTRQEIEQATCAELVETDAIEFAWIGDIDPVENRLDPRAWAGDEQGYFTAVSLSLDDGPAEPAVRAAQTGELSVVKNTAANMAEEPWRSEAVKQGFQSVMSIPLVYQGTSQGVLALYAPAPSAFSSLLQSVLSELGDLTAHAVTAINRKHALAADQMTELDFDVRDRSCFFLQCAQETECTIELEGVVPQSDGSWLVFVKIDGETHDTVLEHAERASEVKSSRLIGADDDALVQFQFTESFVASVLTEQGLTLRSVMADSEKCRITVAVPPQFDIRRAVEVVSTAYPDSELLAKREQRRSLESAGNSIGSVLERLTPRQREVIETAYLSGYFDSPRKANGEELAEELDISTSALHQHIRAAEHKLFETVFDGSVSS